MERRLGLGTIPNCGGGLEPLPSLGEGSYLGKRCHNEVLSVPAIKDRGRSGVLASGHLWAWVEKG